MMILDRRTTQISTVKFKVLTEILIFASYLQSGILHETENTKYSLKHAWLDNCMS